MSDDLKEGSLQAPEGVGPHEERELELMLAGAKPMAKFVDEKAWGYDFGEENFDKQVATGDLIKREEVCDFPKMEFPTRYVYYARPEEAWRIPVIHALQVEHLKSDERETPAQAEITGKLLGYSDDEIQVYIRWVGRTDPDVNMKRARGPYSSQTR